MRTNPQREAVITAKQVAKDNGTTLGPNSRVMRDYVASLPVLAGFLLEVAIGLMLGDVYLQPNAKGTAYRLRFEWGAVNKAYAEHVFDLFSLYCIADMVQMIRTNHLGNQVETWRFHTVFTTAFNGLADIFLGVDGKKCIQIDKLMPFFSSVSLAYWFMDDGNTSRDRYGVSINTQGFTPDEVMMLCQLLIQLYKLDCWVKISKGLPVLVISGHSYDAFFKLVSPHIVPSMRRKFPQLPRTVWTDTTPPLRVVV